MPEPSVCPSGETAKKPIYFEQTTRPFWARLLRRYAAAEKISLFFIQQDEANKKEEEEEEEKGGKKMQ